MMIIETFFAASNLYVDGQPGGRVSGGKGNVGFDFAGGFDFVDFSVGGCDFVDCSVSAADATGAAAD